MSFWRVTVRELRRGDWFQFVGDPVAYEFVRVREVFQGEAVLEVARIVDSYSMKKRRRFDDAVEIFSKGKARREREHNATMTIERSEP